MRAGIWIDRMQFLLEHSKGLSKPLCSYPNQSLCIYSLMGANTTWLRSANSSLLRQPLPCWAPPHTHTLLLTEYTNENTDWQLGRESRTLTLSTVGGHIFVNSAINPEEKAGYLILWVFLQCDIFKWNTKAHWTTNKSFWNAKHQFEGDKESPLVIWLSPVMLDYEEMGKVLFWYVLTVLWNHLPRQKDQRKPLAPVHVFPHTLLEFSGNQ